MEIFNLHRCAQSWTPPIISKYGTPPHRGEKFPPGAITPVSAVGTDGRRDASSLLDVTLPFGGSSIDCPLVGLGHLIFQVDIQPHELSRQAAGRRFTTNLQSCLLLLHGKCIHLRRRAEKWLWSQRTHEYRLWNFSEALSTRFPGCLLLRPQRRRAAAARSFTSHLEVIIRLIIEFVHLFLDRLQLGLVRKAASLQLLLLMLQADGLIDGPGLMLSQLLRR